MGGGASVGYTKVEDPDERVRPEIERICIDGDLDKVKEWCDNAKNLKPSVRWVVQCSGDGGCYTTPTLGQVGNTAVFVTADLKGILYCYRADDGKLLWQRASFGLVDGPTRPLISRSGFLYFGRRKTRNHRIYCVNCWTGGVKWVYRAKAIIRMALSPDNQSIVVCEHRRVYALRVVDGSLRWETSSVQKKNQRFCHDTPHFAADGLVLVGTQEGLAYGISKVGALRWQYQTRGPLVCNPVGDHEAVYIPSTDGNLYKVHLQSGELMWKTRFGGPLISVPAVQQPQHGEFLYISGINPVVYAVRRDNGVIAGEHEFQIQQKRSLFGGKKSIRNISHPVLGNDPKHPCVYISTMEGMWCLNGDERMEELWKFDGKCWLPPAVNNAHELIFTTEDRKIFNITCANRSLMERSDHDGNTPLLLACQNKNKEIVKALIDHYISVEADINQTNVEGENAYLLCRKLKLYAAAMFLWQTKDSIFTQDTNNKGRNWLMDSAEEGDMEAVDLCIEQWLKDIPQTRDGLSELQPQRHAHFSFESTIGLRDSFGESAFSLAAKNGHTDVLRKLCLLRDGSGMNFLMKASSKGDIGTVNHIAWMYRDLDLMEETSLYENLTALMLACQSPTGPHVQVAVKLIDNLADAFSPDPNGFSTFHFARKNPKLTPLAAKLVVLHDDDSLGINSATLSEEDMQAVKDTMSSDQLGTLLVNDRDKHGLTWSLEAAGQDDLDAFKFLFFRPGFDLSARGMDNRSAFFIAFENRFYSLTNFILAHVETLSDSDRKAFFSDEYYGAVLAGNSQLPLHIFSYIDIYEVFPQGTTLTLALLHELEDLAAVLIDVGVDVNLCPADGDNAYTIAVTQRLDNVLPDILRHTSRGIDETDERGRTMLMDICEAGLTKGLQQLLRHSPNLDMTDDVGWSATLIACRAHHSQILKELLVQGASSEILFRFLREVEGDTDLVEIALTYGREGINDRLGEEGLTWMMEAAAKADLNLMKMIFNFPANGHRVPERCDLFVRDSHGQSALCHAHRSEDDHARTLVLQFAKSLGDEEYYRFVKEEYQLSGEAFPALRVYLHSILHDINKELP